MAFDERDPTDQGQPARVVKLRRSGGRPTWCVACRVLDEIATKVHVASTTYASAARLWADLHSCKKEPTDGAT